MKLFYKILISLTILFFIPTFAYAATYYVSTTGSDTNPGTKDLPFRKIQTGANKLAAGDTLYVRGGTYNEAVNARNSGTALLPITISGYPGETAILNGTGLDPNSGMSAFLVYLYGSYITFQNFELTYPNGKGVLVVKWPNSTQNATHNVIRNLNIHHIWRQGIDVWGDYTTVENNKVWQTVLLNKASPGSTDWDGAISFGDSTYPYFGMNTIVRNNQVYENYGEGILCMYTDNALIQGNRVWDNWALGIYPDQCSYTTIAGNLVYYTNNHTFWRYTTNPHVGILLSNENAIAGHPIEHDIKVFNNIIVNAGQGINFWPGFTPTSALINDTVANNTIVENYSWGKAFGLQSPIGTNNQNTIIENNLVYVSNGASPGYFDSLTGLTFKNNLWSAPPPSNVLGTNSIIADPKLVNPTQAIDLDQITNPVNPGWYALSSLSPAINTGVNLTTILTNDYAKVTRPQGSGYDIGAYEFIAGATPTSTPTPLPTPTPAIKPGDANADGKVDETDYGIWLSHFGQTVTGGASVGDFDANGKVDGADYSLWLKYYGT